MKKKQADLLFPVLLIAAAVAGLNFSRSFSASAAILPRFTLIAIIVCSVLEIGISRRGEDGEISFAFGRFAAVILAMLAYIVLVDKAGYYCCTFVFIDFLMWRFGVRDKKYFILVPAGFLLFVYVVFTRGLSIHLPSGILI